MTARAARMTWGAVALISEGAPEGLPYTIEASADGTNWGNPEAIVTQVQSRLQDGSLAAVDSYGNRQASVNLWVTADTYDGLAAAEAVLVAETQRPGYNTLAWTPDEDDAPVSVFDVVYGVLTISQDAGWDLDEVRQGRFSRQFVATLTCLPFPRSDMEVVATAPPTPPDEPTTVTVDDGTSADDWSGTFLLPTTSGSLTPSVSGGAVFLSATSFDVGTPVTMISELTVALDTSTLKYVIVDWKLTGLNSATLTGAAVRRPGSRSLLPISVGPSPDAGYTRSVFVVDDDTDAATALLLGSHGTISTASTFGLWVKGIEISDEAPTSTGTRRQLFRTLPVAGTMRTQGRLAIEHDTDGLGEVLVYVYANDSSGYLPQLRQYYAAGGTVTTDAATVSGAYNMLDTAVTFQPPSRTLPSGSYRLYAMLKGSSAGQVSLFIQAGSVLDDVPLPGAQALAVTLDITTGWKVYDLTGFALPTNAGPVTQSGEALEWITILDPDTSGIDIYLDEAWLFNENIGPLTHIDCGAGTGAAGGPSNRLWLDPATVTSDGQPAVYIGHAADRSDAYNPGEMVKGWTPPEFEPPTANVFTVTPGALDAEVTLSHFPRWLHNARAVS